MAANDTTQAAAPEATVTPVVEPEAVRPPVPDGVSTPDDRPTTAEEGPTSVDVNTDAVEAQVPGKPAAPQSQVPVHETHVHSDRVITDTSDPLAVQVPPAGRGDALTPIARAWAGDKPRTVEDVFRAESSKS